MLKPDAPRRPAPPPERPLASSPTPRVPAAFDDAVVWAAWLYYADQLNQSDVAKALHVSRATVVNLLQEARERGVVSISLRADLVARTTLARRLAERYRLAEALVIPSRAETLPKPGLPKPGLPKPDLPGAAIPEPAMSEPQIPEHNLVDRLGDAAARLLAEQLRPSDVIGVAWGRTVLAAARAITLPAAVSPLTVVQVAGSSTASADFSPELCTSMLASRLNARCVNLLAPALLSTAELRDRLLDEPMLRHQLELVRASTRLLFGVGDLGVASTVRRSGYASAETVARYVAAGAEAVVIGRFIGADGQGVAGALNDRMVGITLDELRSVPMRIGVAGGRAKQAAIRATLAGAYATHLVTDVDTAQALLA